jgi:hypothetical protein
MRPQTAKMPAAAKRMISTGGKLLASQTPTKVAAVKANRT